MERRRVRAFCFQAEDGIRDLTVTGVQTCALPISSKMATCCSRWEIAASGPTTFSLVYAFILALRSEERRVGKECRSRWRPDRYTENAPEFGVLIAIHEVRLRTILLIPYRTSSSAN